MSDAPEPTRLYHADQEIVLRTAEPDDFPRTRAVRWSVGWADPPSTHRIWPEADADWQTRRYFREIVAEVDGVLAGRVGLEAFRPPFAEIIDLSVRPEFRRQGLGKLLTQECLRQAARRGFTAVFLQTELDNQAAHRLYTRLGFVPTAHGKMLRLLKFLDYPLLNDFCHKHPLNLYACTPIFGTERAWNMEWHAYITNDYLRLRLEGGASKSESEGIGPALTGFNWRVQEGARELGMRLQSEAVGDLEPGNHVELQVSIRNFGRRSEAGIFKMQLPPGVRVSEPATNRTQRFVWEVAPDEEVLQPVVLQIESDFDAGTLWYLNYHSLPVCMEAYWEGQRGQLSLSLPMAVPPPRS